MTRSENPTHSPGTRWVRLLPVWVALPCALFYSFALSTHCRLDRIGICVDPYWMDHYLHDYAQGFARRGLTGEIARRVLGAPLSIVGLNVASFLAVLGTLWLLGAALWPHLSRPARVVVLAILATSPVASLFFETLGDPLQGLILIHLLAFPWVLRMRRIPARVVLMAGLILFGALIHEASLFLISPALVLAITGLPARGRDGWRILLMLAVVPLMVTAGLVALLPDAGRVQADASAPAAVNELTGSSYVYAGSLASSYAKLLTGEKERYFGSVRNVIKASLKPIQVSWVPCWAFMLISGCAQARRFRTALLKSWGLLMAASLPLYVIGHDWGRFTIYTLVLSVYTACLLTSGESDPAHHAEPVQAEGHPSPGPDPTLLRAFIAFGMMSIAYPVWDLYRINGMPTFNALALTVILLVAALVALVRHRGSDLWAALKSLAGFAEG